MRTGLKSTFVAGMVLIVAAFVTTRLSAQGTGARPAILAENKRIAEGVAKSDTGLIASAYAADPEAFPPNSDGVRGRAAIEKMWRSLLDSGVTVFEVVTSDVDTQGDVADEKGSYTLKMKDGKVFNRGNYHNVWKKENGQWKLQRNTLTPEK